MSDTRSSVLCLAFGLWASGLWACASEPQRGVVDLGEGQDPSSVADASSGTGNTSDAAVCAEDLTRRATALLDSHRSCTRDEDCRAQAIAAPCPARAASSCTVFVRKDTDVLWTAMAELEQAYLACGGAKCAGAKCGERPRTEAYCNAAKQCDGRKLDLADPDRDAGVRADASVPVGDAAVSNTADASVPPDAASSVDARFACEANLDCVVKDVGNCCGYYPRCANVAATFFPPNCSGGQAGVCGFPTITSCECIQKQCVSVSGQP